MRGVGGHRTKCSTESALQLGELKTCSGWQTCERLRHKEIVHPERACRPSKILHRPDFRPHSHTTPVMPSNATTSSEAEQHHGNSRIGDALLQGARWM